MAKKSEEKKTLTDVAVDTLKSLMAAGNSDEVRLEAAKVVLDLAKS